MVASCWQAVWMLEFVIFAQQADRSAHVFPVVEPLDPLEPLLPLDPLDPLEPDRHAGAVHFFSQFSTAVSDVEQAVLG
jgi:hypothetical protein